MVVAAQADCGRVVVVDGPADVVVAAQVGDPGGGGGLDRQVLEGLDGQRRVARREHGPDLDHEGVVVGQVGDLAGVLALAEVLEELGGGDDRLGLEVDGGADDASQGAQDLGDGVDLGLALAVGALALDGEGDGVQAQHLDAAVGQVQDDAGELGHDVGVAPVEVPLEGVEGGPHPAAHAVVPGEVAGGEVGEDLRQGALVGVGLGAVGEDEEVVAVALLAGAGPHRPLVLGGHVVEDEVHHQGDALGAQLAGQVLKVLHGAQVRAHGAVVGDRVAAVGVARARGEQGHEVEIGDAQLTQVVDAVLHAAQGAGEALGIGGVSDAARVLDPGGVEGTGQIQAAQLVVALRVGPGGQSQQVEDLLLGGVAVEGGEPVEKVGVPGLGAREEDVPLHGLKRVQDVEDDVVEGWREGSGGAHRSMVPDSESPRYSFPHRRVSRGAQRQGDGAVGHAVGHTVGPDGHQQPPAGSAPLPGPRCQTPEPAVPAA